jgi:hypothetical protein
MLGTVTAFAGDEQTCNGRAPTVSGTTGTDGDDVMIGTAGNDVLYGGGGDDAICGLGGNDRLFGDNADAGNDYLDGGPGDDYLEGRLGDDYLDGGDGERDVVSFSAYVDEPAAIDLARGSAEGPEGTDTLVTGTIEDVLMNCSSTGDDVLIGDADDNVLSAGSGRDRVEGGAGDDVLYGTDPSVNRTDAICWSSQGDEDTLVGGAGDDTLLGHVSADSLDGGEGFDVLDGGSAHDVCDGGERYARCEETDPPPPPEACADGVDNDGDGRVDHPADTRCASPQDPTEDSTRDPECYDGVDNDGDRGVDYPEDIGCTALSEDRELLQCFCPPRAATIRYERRTGAFSGSAGNPGTTCAPDRVVVLKQVRRGRDRTRGSTLSTDDGKWAVPGHYDASGRFYVAIQKRTFVSAQGDTTVCARHVSDTIKV